MLEGLLHPISGSQSVWASTFKDKNCPEKLERVPQHNAFFEKLTLRYNLGLYATFKGVARNQIKKRVDNMIFELELELIQKQLASTHSDGQKRKT